MAAAIEVETGAPGVTVLRMNRPRKLNALDLPAFKAFARALAAACRDPDAGALVITGTGRGFCAGNDLEQPDPGPREVEEIVATVRAVVRTMLETPLPIVTAVKGPAVGIGLAVALAADVSIVATDALLIDGLVRLGVTSGEHAVAVWPLLAGLGAAKYHLLQDPGLRGHEADRLGLVGASVPADEVWGRALDLARRMTRGDARRRLTRMKKFSLGLWHASSRGIFEHALAQEKVDFAGPDVVEGRRAFRAGRRPRFPSAEPPEGGGTHSRRAEHR